MANLDTKKRKMYIRWFLLRFGMVLFDIFAVNISYYLALLIRFYVNFEFNVWALRYLPVFQAFAPWYTACCIAVFAVLGLYNSMWKYAGLNDMNRVLTASLITCIIQIIGTLAFFMRMPITYYGIGAAIQFLLIAVSRFSYRLFLIEKGKIVRGKKGTAVNVMVVGVGESSRIVMKHLDRDVTGNTHTACVLDFEHSELGGMMDGVPVIGGIDRIPSAVKKYHIDRVMLADSVIPQDLRKSLRQVCGEIGVEVQNFSGYFQTAPSRITLKNLAEYLDGSVAVSADGKTRSFPDGIHAAEEIPEKYIVKSIRAEDGNLHLDLMKDILIPNDVNEDWVRSYVRETGEDISFF